MATQEYRIVSAEESEIHDEPHVLGRRLTVRDIYDRIERRGLAAEEVAERFDLDLATVYEALAYYHGNPGEMERVRTRHERATAEAERRSSPSPPES